MNFLDSSGNAIYGLQDFVKAVRQFIDDDEISSSLSAMDILLPAMLPDKLPEGQTLLVRTEGRKGDQRRPKSSECVHEAELGGHITDIMVKVFDVCFALVGIGGPFGGTSKIAGRSVVNKIIRGAGGKQFIAQASSIISCSVKSPKDAGELFAATVSAVGLNGILDAISDAITLTFAANLLAIGLSSGVSFAVKFANADGLALNGVYTAFDAFNNLQPGPPPGLKPRPTHEPSPGPTPIPSHEPIPMQTPEPTPASPPTPTTRPTDTRGLPTIQPRDPEDSESVPTTGCVQCPILRSVPMKSDF